MVRTKDSAGVKVSGAKAPRKIAPVASVPNTSDSGQKNKYAGGNPYCPRETPEWQKPITNFFGAKPKAETSTSASETPNVTTNTSSHKNGSEGGASSSSKCD